MSKVVNKSTMWSAKVPRRSESVARPRYKATSNDGGEHQMPQRSKEKARGLETKALNQLLKPNLEKIKRCLNDGKSERKQ